MPPPQRCEIESELIEIESELEPCSLSPLPPSPLSLSRYVSRAPPCPSPLPPALRPSPSPSPLPLPQACTHRQLDLATTLHDRKGQEDAFLQLGGLAQAQGEYREAHEYFEKAFHEAQGHQDTETANLARLSLGVTDGSREFDEFIKGMAAA